MYAYPSSIEIASQFDSALSISLRFTRLAIEFSAVILSKVVTDFSLAALESGVITRHWLQANGGDLVKKIGWATLQALKMVLLGLACLVYASVFSSMSFWKVARKIWAWVNQATDDGLGLYGPSPMLAEWKKQFNSLLTMEMPAFTPLNTPCIPALELLGDELVAWAQRRWPELKEIGQK